MNRKNVNIAIVSLVLGLVGGTMGAFAAEQPVTAETNPLHVTNVAIGEASAIQIGVDGGAKLAVKARALKNLSDTLHIGYYDRDGTLQADDEYGYGTHDINRLLSIDEVKSFPVPIKEVIVSIKDENGVVLLSMPAKLTSMGV
ncbi:hypothetical protein NUT31_21730 (plasmid) [Aeromonas sp. BC14]|uniref:hypothetical protein n=1 Tax=Aeromonas sp. DNRA1 TaxID=2729335 RepID=UPI0014597D7E|nr:MULTISPECIES: hypothetical protein [unclassified Aeromonas]NME02857.1 hypothetical protein [Aeromonas sp. DNRA1]WAF97022.1 hypothetical protein NUT31_21730 [Aeromonas sp. BC14]